MSLRHLNITTTSRYLPSTPRRLARALSLRKAAVDLFPHHSHVSPDPQPECESKESVQPLDGDEDQAVDRREVEPPTNRRGCLLLCRAMPGSSL